MSVPGRDAAIQWAASIEAACGASASHMDLAAAFKEVAPLLPDDDERRRASDYERMILDLFLPEPGDYRDRFGPLAPMMVAGEVVYPPPIDQFPDDALAYYRQRQPTIGTPAGRARYADFLWLREKDHMQARAAIDAYQEAAAALGADDVAGMVRVEYLRRAVELARTLKVQGPSLPLQVLETAEGLLSASGPGFLCRVIELGGAEIATHRERALILRDSIIDRARGQASSGGEARHFERSLLGAAAELSRNLGLQHEANDLEREAARSIEREAEDRVAEGDMIRAFLLRDALDEYTRLGMAAEIALCKRRLNEASQQAESELKTISAEHEVSREDIEEGVDEILKAAESGGSLSYLIVLSLLSGLWPKWGEIEKQAAADRQAFPLQYLFKKVSLGPDGQPMPRPDDGSPDQALFDEAGTYGLRVQIALQFTAWQVAILRERGLWSTDLLEEVLIDSPLFEGARPLIRAGLEDFEADRHWSALHVLLPQVERGLRELSRVLGGDIFRLERGTNRLRYASLEQILQHEPVREFLNEISPSLALELELLLIHPFGMNIRNNVAHGVISADMEPFGFALTLVLILLALATVTRKQPVDDASNVSPESPE